MTSLSPSQPRSDSTRGFTLVEVIITALLIVVVMVPVTRLSFTIMRSTQYARDVGEAISAGQTQLEAFEEMDFDNIADGTSSVGKYDLAWIVTTTDNNKVVHLEVDWKILDKDISIDLNTVFSPDSNASFNLP